MFTNYRTLFICLSLLIASSGFSQEQIERLFRSDRQNAAIDVAQTADMGYLIYSAGRPTDSLQFEYYTVSKFDNKGNFSWSRDYDFSPKVLPDGSLTLLADGGFIISGVLDTNTTNKVLLRGDAIGDVLWTKAFGQDDQNIPTALRGDAPTDETPFGSLLMTGTTFSDINDRNVFLSEIDTSGNQIWGKAYNRDLIDLVATSVKSTIDSGIIVTGALSDASTDDIFLIKTDSVGDIEWARQYGEVGVVERGTAILPVSDGGYLIGATKNNTLLASQPGLLIKTDTFGNAQWFFDVDFETSDTVLINDMILANDGNIVVSGSLLGTNDETFAWMMKISINGDMIWKRRYKATTRQNVLANELIEASMGGYIYITSSDEGSTQVGPYLIKTLANGSTICDSIIDEQLIFPLDSILTDTLILMTSDVNDSLDVMLADTLNYGGYQVVVLNLFNNGPYCPGEIFSDTLDATTDGAVSYEWESGETTPFIVATQPGDYMVTVTIGEDYCYTLCASTTISERSFPTVSLDFDDGTYCSNGTVTVLTESTDVDTYVWSTGDDDSNIIVDTEGLYAVTVTNECGSEEDEIQISFDTSAPEVDISVTGNFCTDGTELLTAATSFPVNAFLWSNGDETNSTTIDALGTYSVTAISNFCDDGTADYTVEPTPLSVSIVRDTGLCTEGIETLALNTTASTFSWSTGEITQSIEVSIEGTYAVTVSDFCTTDSTSIDLLCPLVFELPNVFTPDDRETENDIFIPLFAFNPASLVEYEFKVFSRWGEVVFETNNPTEGWDGRINDEVAPMDTYFYTIQGENDLGVRISRQSGKENHGDVTLLR